ncbi:MAG: hypothetical protein LBG44_06305 [Gemmatimonadota bacterium]|nr:hypothetical protein [Gemmatimonadota bacterium]
MQDPYRLRPWYGSLIMGQADASGLSYRRNRYYSPVSGQFTQPDPIGIAGGLNVYGYANGDPVNFSDPFGLCPANERDAAGVCPLVEATFSALGALVGYGAGGGAGGAFGLAMGGFGALVTAPAGAQMGAAMGATAGLAIGQMVTGVMFRGGETSATQRGRAEHAKYSADRQAEGYTTNRQIPGSRLRPDAIDVERGIIRELKPNNPAAEMRGLRQLSNYARAAKNAYGKVFSGVVDFY